MDFVVVPAEFSLGHNRRMQMAWHLPAPSRASNSLPSMSSLMKSIAIQCDQHHRLSKGLASGWTVDNRRLRSVPRYLGVLLRGFCD
jgi:hypothetical protein